MKPLAKADTRSKVKAVFRPSTNRKPRKVNVPRHHQGHITIHVFTLIQPGHDQHSPNPLKGRKDHSACPNSFMP
jgi:hypothetical protein